MGEEEGKVRSKKRRREDKGQERTNTKEKRRSEGRRESPDSLGGAS